MGYHPRIETSKISSLNTSRSRNSELWFINNPELEEATLGYMAKFSARYGTKLYGAALEGNHMHTLAQFPELNRASFYRDLNSCVAKAVARHAESYPGGPLWARRYSSEFVPGDEDIENYFFYVVLQPVLDGLVDRISDYPGYNCFHDAVNGTKREVKVIDWARYNDKKRWHKNVDIKDFTETYELKYERLPGYRHMSQKKYRSVMLKKLEERRKLAISKRDGKPSVGAEALKSTRPGSRPKHSKTSHRFSHRPRTLSVCPKRRKTYNTWYFNIYFRYREASKLFRAGDLTVKFPPGTYRPPSFTCKTAEPPEL